MGLNSQPASARLRAGVRLVKSFRERGTMSLAEFDRLAKVLSDVATDVEEMEIAAGTAPLNVQLKAAGANPVALRAVLRIDAAKKVARHG